MTDTILIVDDSSFIVEGLAAILKKKYRIIAVYGGAQCLEILEKETPAIIILDILMEPMDGWETLVRIKENSATRHIPVLMFSAKKISAEEAEEHRISIDDFVSKPVTPKKLIESIEKVLARQKANRANIEVWRSAGISQDRIDKYTTLMTNLEVDMSLLQNMKVQLSLVRDDDEKIRTDLEAVIISIERRIEQERFSGEKYSREMQESVSGNIKEKERVVPVPAKNENVQEILPVDAGINPAAQPELADLSVMSESETNLSAGKGIEPEVSVLRQVTAPEITPIPEIYPPVKGLPDTDVIPEPASSFSLFEDGDFEQPPGKEPDMIVVAESPGGKRTHNPVCSGLSFPKEIPQITSSSRPLSPETRAGKTGQGMDASTGKNAPHVTQQKIPADQEPWSLRARTLDNKPVNPETPMPGPFGSGTDTSSRSNTVDVGRSFGNKEVTQKAERVSDKDTTPPSGGFISRIISMIMGIFKRPGK